MKKIAKNLTFFLLLTSIIIPIFPAITVAQDDDEVIFRVSASALPGDWDPAISDGYNVIYGSYMFSAMEYPCGGNANFSGGVYIPLVDEWKPIIVTNWTMEHWPSEENSLGFNNTGGNMAMTLTLREGVKFHDGSDWNATAMKWNIDRRYIITGNLTGNGDKRNEPTYWAETDIMKQYWTTSWNLSEYDADGISYGVDDYSYYYIDDPALGESSKVKNPNPFGGLDGTGNPINYAPYDRYPLIRWVEIVEDKQSGGTVRVHYNSWNSYGMEGGLYGTMMSYHAYHKNYTDRGIYGYENGVKDPKNPTIVDHMIGTGPYIYVEHDQTGSPPGGYMIKNENYWNKTALEAEGWFDVDKREVVNFPTGGLGQDAQNTALLTYAIDYCYDSMYMPINYDAVMADPKINYYDDYPSEYLTQVTLNCINETWWTGEPAAAFGYVGGGMPSWYPNEKGDPWAQGIPRALREAMSYAFDYDKMINTRLKGRAVRCGGLAGVANIYYNESIPLPDFNLTKARNILLTTEDDPYTFTYTQNIYNFSKLCADRSLTASSSDAAWQNVANTNPIFELKFFWDDAHTSLRDQLKESCALIGVGFWDEAAGPSKVSTIIWDTVRDYWNVNFDGTHSIWSASSWVMDYNIPATIPEGWIDANYADPNHGTWRAPTYYVTDYWPTWNFGFAYDAEVDDWIDRMYMSHPSEKIKWISKICEKEQTEIFPMLYTYQAKGGECLLASWETFWVLDRDDRPAGYWGGISTHFLRYIGFEDDYALIPAAPLLVTLTVSAISMLGIIYAIIRKRNLR